MCVSSDRKPAKHADERSYPGGTCVSLETGSIGRGQGVVKGGGGGLFKGGGGCLMGA